jgi:hypothetical protein
MNRPTLHTIPEATLARLRSRAKGGFGDASVLLHLVDRADQRDQDVAKFVDSYSSTIAALCRRLEALERGANLRQRDEDAEATESDSVADTAQRITDYAAKAGLTVQDWANAFNAAPVDDSPVADALLQAEQVAGEELLKLANSKRSQPGRPGTPPAPEPGEVGVLVKMLTQEAAILEAYCNKIANGECRTLACLQRGGYIRGTESPDSSAATCPELEKAVAKRRAATLLQQQESELDALRGALEA